MKFTSLHDLNKSQSNNIMKGFSDDLEKGAKFLVGQLDKSGKNVKTIDGWKPVKSHGHLVTHNTDGTPKQKTQSPDKDETANKHSNVNSETQLALMEIFTDFDDKTPTLAQFTSSVRDVMDREDISDNEIKQEYGRIKTELAAQNKLYNAYKREPFKSTPIAEGDIMLRPDFKAGNYNDIKITSIKDGYANFDIVDQFNGSVRTMRTDAGRFRVSELQNFKDERDKKVHEDKEDVNEKVHDISEKIGIDKLRGGNPGVNIYELDKALKGLASEFSNKADSSTGAAAGWSGTMRSSVSGQAISVDTNDVHRGGYYEGSTPYLIQVKIGGGLDSKDYKVAKEVATRILSKYSLKADEHSDSYVTTTSGTNWSSVMLTAPRKSDSYVTQPSLKSLNSIKS